MPGLADSVGCNDEDINLSGQLAADSATSVPEASHGQLSTRSDHY